MLLTKSTPRKRLHPIDAQSRRALVATFATELGWMAAIGRRSRLEQLVFGYDTDVDAIAALDAELAGDAEFALWCPALVARLQAYARGRKIGLSDVPIAVGRVTDFQRHVIENCRRIAFGATVSYGQLAAAAGVPGAARAVGNVMAANRLPLVVPCHRVIGSAGNLGGFSARHGIAMKSRLLELERRACRL